MARQCLAALLAVCMISVPIAIQNQLVDAGPSWWGLDISWKMTLSYACVKDWVWGKDIVYTYGPLAAFSTRIGWGVSRWVFMLFDGFMVVNFYFVFNDFLKNNANKILAVSVLFCTMLVVNQIFGADLSWVMLFFIIYWMMKTFDQPRPVFLAILIILTVLTFYVKMNTGLIAMVLVCLHVVNLFASKKIILVKLVVLYLCLIALTMVSATLLHVAVFSYITGSLEIVKGYNDIMYLDENHPVIQYGLYLLFLSMLLWFSHQLWRQLKQKKYSLILYTIAGVVYIFLLQKQSVLRNDRNHLYEYYSFATLILLGGFAGFENRKTQLKYSLAFVVFALCFVSVNRPPWFSIINRITGPVTYVKQFAAYDSFVYLNQQNKRYIPKRVLDKIGSKTVDVFPWDSEYAIENKLNYKPRPVFQSFSVYTEALEQINYNYYTSHPPEFLIYDYDTIDGRYAFNDESVVNLFILNNYAIIDSFKSNERPRIVLQRKSNTTALQFKILLQDKFSLNDTLNTRDANFIKLDIQYNLIGKTKALFGSPPHVQIAYMRDDGHWFTFKTSTELLKAGLFTGGFVANDDDYIALLAGKHFHAIKKIRLDINSIYFKESGMITASFVNAPTDTALKK